MATTQTKYDVEVTRDGKWWMIRIPRLDESLTQARRVAEIGDMAREYIATTLDLDLDTIEIGHIALSVDGVDYGDISHQVNQLRAEAKAAEERASALMRSTALTLSAQGIPVRDIGAVLGVSYQRAGQLLAS